MDALNAILKELQLVGNKALKYQELTPETREAIRALNRAIAAEIQERNRLALIERSNA